MSKSPFFARIKADVLKVMASVPRGHLVTFLDVGQHLDIMPRHVAYILAQLEGEEQAATPWFRAVAENGVLSRPKSNDFGISQRTLLEEEGHLIAPDGRILDLAQKLLAVAVLNSGDQSRRGPPMRQKPAAESAAESLTSPACRRRYPWGGQS
ncbi:MAG: MGMT family protein [Beijerinckiaceae bacterium]